MPTSVITVAVTTNVVKRVCEVARVAQGARVDPVSVA
jgi:hypothetical protein